MKRKLLTTTVVSMSLLSLNLFAAGQMKCTGGVCIVDLSKNSPSVKKTEIKTQETKKQEIKKDTDAYKTVLVDNIETITLPHSKYIMTQDEVAEYDLGQMQKNLLTPALNPDLPLSEHLCADNAKPVKVAGVENTYECQNLS